MGTQLTNFRTLQTYALVLRRIEQDQMRGRTTYLGAGHHQTEVLRLHMLAALLEAMRHRRA